MLSVSLPAARGRVSSAKTRTIFPAFAAERMTPKAVPYPAVARAPALQWVRTRAFSGIRGSPKAPMARLIFSSSAAISRAKFRSFSFISAKGRSLWVLTKSFILSNAQKRLTAVGGFEPERRRHLPLRGKTSRSFQSGYPWRRRRRQKPPRHRWPGRRVQPWYG